MTRNCVLVKHTCNVIIYFHHIAMWKSVQLQNIESCDISERYFVMRSQLEKILKDLFKMFQTDEIMFFPFRLL